MSNNTLSEKDCDQWQHMFTQINAYFRNEIVLEGTDHASVELGWCITFAYCFVIVFGALGNMLTVLAVIRNPQMRTTRNFFIVNLALSDFFVCTITTPITLYTVLYTFWPFGTATCKIAGSLQGFGIFLSTFSIAAIALDRYVLVIFPTKRKRQHNLSLLFFSLIWLISIALALPLLIASDLNTIFEDKNCDISLKICHEKNEIWQEMPIGKEAYTLAVLITQYALPLISIVFAYSRIAHRMQGRFSNRMSSCPNNGTTMSQRRRSVVDRQRRTHLLLVCVVIVFAVAWLPLNVFHVLNTFGIVKGFSVPLFALCHVIAMGSACLNPVSYAFFNHNFRQQFVAMFQQFGLSHLRDLFVHVRQKCMQGRRKKYTTSSSCAPATGSSSLRLHANALRARDDVTLHEEHEPIAHENECVLRIDAVNAL